VRLRTTIIPSGRYKGYILEYLPDDVLETLWQELDGDNAYTRAQSRIYSEEERTLLLLLISEIGERWDHSATAIILPAVQE
jgi:hypothetical protein